MSTAQDTQQPSVIEIRRADPGPDAIVQLLVAARRTLEQATVLTDHMGDLPTAGFISSAADAISMAMDQRILGANR